MENRYIWQVALQQSAVDLNCDVKDLLAGENRVVLSAASSGARKYLHLPQECHLVSYGSNIVAAVRKDVKPAVENYLQRCSAAHGFETPGIHVLDRLLQPYGLQTCFMAEYFLPDVARVQALPCRYEMRLLHQADFAELYLPKWSNALCADRRHLDVLGVGAYDGERLVGLAACSADGEEMWQIGVDVLPAYRRQGIASALTSRLALEIMQRGKVPFYCAAWCNVASARNAVKCGFHPAWVELSARDMAFVAEMNQ